MPKTYQLHSEQLEVIPKNAKIDYKEELNEEQLKVVTADNKPKLVLAGAGSGKTRTLTYRVAYLIETGVDPRRIILMTFTNKAAREMLNRVSMLLGGRPKGIWGGTFHHIGNRILRKYARLVGYEPNFTIMDSEDSKSLIKNIISTSGINTTSKRFPKAKTIQRIHSYAINCRQSVQDVVMSKFNQYFEYIPQIRSILKVYHDRKLALGLMDFDDLLLNWLKLMKEHEDVREKLSAQFEHVLVDEYQDTNKIQAQIIDLLASVHQNVLIVGDDAQSIYSFRGAEFRNILEFESRYPGAQIYKLETNYRSTPQILNFANASIDQNVNQYKKVLKPVLQDGELPAVIPLQDVEQQAEFIAQRILELRDDGVELEQIGVLYRAHFHSLELQVELTRRNIPFQIRSGLRFFEQAHIKDVISFLKLLVNSRDQLAWARVLAMYPGIGKKTIEKIWRKINAETATIEEIIQDEFHENVPKRAHKSWKSLTLLLKMLLEESVSRDPAEQIKIIINRFYNGYAIDKFENYKDRLEDLEQLGIFASGYESTDDFLTEVSLQESVKGETVIGEDEEEDEEKVILSTIHRAKGLEWTAVFVMYCAENFFPSARSYDEPGQLEEERRLFYVAATRAKKHLYLTYPTIAKNWDGWVVCRPSKFIKELPGGTYEKWVVEEDNSHSEWYM